MAPQRGIRKTGLALALVAMVCHLWGGARGQSSCTSALTSLASCLNYIGGNSSTPSSSCCSSLASVVQSNPQCLCSALNGGAASGLGISINQTRALQLPSACNVQTPPASRCSTGTGASPSPPTASPSASPSADDSPDGADSPAAFDVPEGSGSGSKTVPSTDAGSSGGNTTKAAPLSLLLLLLFVATFGSTAAAI